MRHRTYEHLSKVAVTWWSKRVRAHTVLPVGRKANWSTILRTGIAGKIHLETTNYSATLERKGVTSKGTVPQEKDKDVTW